MEGSETGCGWLWEDGRWRVARRGVDGCGRWCGRKMEGSETGCGRWCGRWCGWKMEGSETGWDGGWKVEGSETRRGGWG